MRFPLFSGIYVRFLCLALAAHLASCTPGFFLGGGNTYGVPAQWVINEDIYGQVLDFDSCSKMEPANEDILFSFYPLTCSPIQGAEIILSAEKLPFIAQETGRYEYTTRTDDDGRFTFERRTAIELVKNRYTNRYYGRLTINVEGNPPIYRNMSNTAIERPYFFLVTDVKKPIVVFLNKYKELTKR